MNESKTSQIFRAGESLRLMEQELVATQDKRNAAETCMEFMASIGVEIPPLVKREHSRLKGEIEAQSRFLMMQRNRVLRLRMDHKRETGVTVIV